MSIGQRLSEIRKKLPVDVELVAISKTKPESDILEAYAVGQRHFGENKVQDLTEKFEHLPKDISWHFIGHLQTNKVKYIAPFIHLVHAVDSLKLLKMLQKEALKNNRTIQCLIQAKVAKEDTKFGLSFLEINDLLKKKEDYPNVKIVGLMAMGTNTSDNEEVRREFKAVNNFFESLKNDEFKVLSMGMSNDWPLAVEQGSNMIRVGSRIFGPRNY